MSRRMRLQISLYLLSVSLVIRPCRTKKSISLEDRADSIQPQGHTADGKKREIAYTKAQLGLKLPLNISSVTSDAERHWKLSTSSSLGLGCVE